MPSPPIRPHSQTPDSAAPAQDAASKEWEEHEQVAPAVELEAQRLLEAAGAKERAKHAIDEVAERSDAERDGAHDRERSERAS